MTPKHPSGERKSAVHSVTLVTLATEFFALRDSLDDAKVVARIIWMFGTDDDNNEGEHGRTLEKIAGYVIVNHRA